MVKAKSTSKSQHCQGNKMQIDDYEQAIALKTKLEQVLPFRVRPRKQLLKAMKDALVTEQTWLEVDSVFYAGDEGGIVLSLMPVTSQKETVYSVSLTHVEFDPNHELAAELKAYQSHRTHKLMLKDRKGFPELLGQTRLKKRQSRKGFGKNEV
jgi:hypothetical protein